MGLTPRECHYLCQDMLEIVNRQLDGIDRIKSEDPPGWWETMYEAMEGATIVAHLQTAICDRLQEISDQSQTSL